MLAAEETVLVSWADGFSCRHAPPGNPTKITPKGSFEQGRGVGEKEQPGHARPDGTFNGPPRDICRLRVSIDIRMLCHTRLPASPVPP